VCLLDEAGAVRRRLRVPHSAAGLRRLREAGAAAEPEAAAVCVAVERGEGLPVEALVAAGYTVYALNPKAVERYRGRTRVAGAKSDRADAELLARILLTDRARHRPLCPSHPRVAAVRVLARVNACAGAARRSLPAIGASLTRLRDVVLPAGRGRQSAGPGRSWPTTARRSEAGLVRREGAPEGRRRRPSTGRRARTRSRADRGHDYAPLAAAHYTEALAVHHAAGRRLETAVVLQNLGRLAHLQGDPRRAVARLAESLTLFRALGDRGGIGLCVAALAGVAGAAGRWDRAARRLGAAQALLPAPVSRLGTVNGDEFDRTVAAARAHLGAAAFAAAWDAGQAMTLETAIADALDDLAPAPPPGRGRPAPAAPLTRREREVAALVAEGLSNREIADRLVITERTAEGHVAHILNKLGARTRVQIATWIVEPPPVPSRPRGSSPRHP